MTTSSSPLAFPAVRLLLAVALSLFLSSKVAVVAGVPEPTSFYIDGDTSIAPVSGGNPWDGPCDGWSVCQNGCRSSFLKVTEGSADITADSCGGASFKQRFYVWDGLGGVCSTFTCEGAYQKDALAKAVVGCVGLLV
jgi:hypothetical protein